MAGFRKYEVHAKLLERMADKMGVDIDEKMMSGQVSPEDLDDTVFRCMSCDEPENCTAWLNTREGVAEDAPPHYCRNKETLDTLKRE